MEGDVDMERSHQSMRKRIFDIIQIGKHDDSVSRLFDVFIAAVIILNITVLFLGTFSTLNRYDGLFEVIEDITAVIFVVEYVLRIWTADYLYPEENRAVAIGKYVISSDGVILLLSILPFFFLSGMVVFRMLRVVRIFHLFRLNAHYDSFTVIGTVFREKRNQIASSIFIISVLILAASLLMYNVENRVQPENFQNAFSGIWWAVSTILTIGYGDIYPITILGKFLGVVIGFLGVFVVALPTGIISAGFVEQYQRMHNDHINGNAAHELNTHNVVVDIASAWIGKTIQEVEEEYDTLILLVRRGKKTVRPSEKYHVEMDDTLVVYHKHHDDVLIDESHSQKVEIQVE